LDKADLEVFYYKLVEGIIKIGKYLKEDTTEFLQNIIESESQIERFYVVRKKLESIWNIFSIVNKSYTEVTNQQ
jgi:outer membrane protein assembly factor BamD (BamD/ComL family)